LRSKDYATAVCCAALLPLLPLLLCAALNLHKFQMNPMAKKAQLNNCHWWSSSRAKITLRTNVKTFWKTRL